MTPLRSIASLSLMLMNAACTRTEKSTSTSSGTGTYQQETRSLQAQNPSMVVDCQRVDDVAVCVRDAVMQLLHPATCSAAASAGVWQICTCVCDLLVAMASPRAARHTLMVNSSVQLVSSVV